jgi:hypothetical protein
MDILGSANAVVALEIIKDMGSPPQLRPGLQMVRMFPEGESVVAMTTYGNNVLIATNVNLYILKGRELRPLVAEVIPDATVLG